MPKVHVVVYDSRSSFFPPLLVYRRICSFAGYHGIQSEILFHGHPNLYTAWLDAVDCQYPAYISDLRTPPPLLLAIPSPRTLVWRRNGYLTIWPYRLSSWSHGWRTVKRYPRVFILGFRFLSNCSEKQMSDRFCLGFFGIHFCYPDNSVKPLIQGIPILG